MTDDIYRAALAWRAADRAFMEADRLYAAGVGCDTEHSEREAWRRVDDAQEALNAARRNLAALCDRVLAVL